MRARRVRRQPEGVEVEECARQGLSEARRVTGSSRAATGCAAAAARHGCSSTPGTAALSAARGSRSTCARGAVCDRCLRVMTVACGVLCARVASRERRADSTSDMSRFSVFRRPVRSESLAFVRFSLQTIYVLFAYSFRILVQNRVYILGSTEPAAEHPLSTASAPFAKRI